MERPPLSYVPSLPLLAMMVLGIVLSYAFPDRNPLFLLLSACGAVLSLFLRQRFISVLFLSVITGLVISDIDRVVHAGNIPTEGVCKAGGVVRSVSNGEMSRRAIVAMNHPYSGDCYLSIPFFSPEIVPGDSIEFTATYVPLVQSCDVEGDIDLTDFYFRNHIEGRCIVLHDSLSVNGTDRSLIYRIVGLQRFLVDMIVRSGLSDESQQFLSALLLGDDSFIGDSVRREQFASAGLAHVLALSGMHVAVIAGVFSILLLPFSLLGFRKLRWCLLLILLWSYALITGLSPSVTRAVIMFSVIIMARCLGRSYSSANSLCLAAIVILVITPRALYTPGFQLSFVAVLSLIVIPSALPEMTVKNKVLRWLINYVIYTLSAVSGTLLLAVYYFHNIPLLFLVTNLLTTLLLPVVLAGSMLVVLLQMFGFDFVPLDRLIDMFCGYILGVAEKASELPGSTVNNLYVGGYTLVVGYALLAVAIYFLYRRRYAPMLLSLVSIAFICIFTGRYTGHADVLFIGRNVGATDIIFTRGSEGYMLTSVSQRLQQDEADRVMSRYSDFFIRRGIDSVSSVNLNGVSQNYVLTFGNKRIMFVNSVEIPLSESPVDYLILSNGFRGDIIDLVAAVDVDSILLGADLNGKLRRRYFSELETAGYNVRQLSGGGYGLVLINNE